MIKKIYQILPFKRSFFSLLKTVYKPNPNLYKHLHFKGIFKVKIDAQHHFKIKHFGNIIENELFWEGINDGWEKVSFNLWIKLCRNANCIIDVGANTGVYALIAKSLNENSKVYAFEPVERVFKKLVYNNQINNYDIKCFELALSNKNGEAIIYDIPNTDHIYSVTVNKNMFTPGTPVVEKTIKTITLDSFINKEKIKNIDLIKIDVETHEPEVIEGYINNIKQHQPTILIEILNDEVGKKIETLIKDIPYLYFNIDENSGVKRVNHILKSDYYNYLLCTEEVAKNLSLI